MPYPVLRRAGAIALLACSACTPGGADYLPLDTSRWWYYEIAETILDEPRERRYVVSNGGRIGLDGEAVQVQRAQTASRDFLRRNGNAVERVAHTRPGLPALVYDQPPRTIVPDPASKPDDTWSVESTLALIESRTFARSDRVIVRRYPVTLEKHLAATDSVVEVPAGRFEHCLEIAAQGRAFVRTDRGNSEAEVQVAVREWYAPGVGLVRLERSETSSSPFLKPGRQVWALADYGE